MKKRQALSIREVDPPPLRVMNHNNEGQRLIFMTSLILGHVCRQISHRASMAMVTVALGNVVYEVRLSTEQDDDE